MVSYLKKYMKIEILNREQKILEAIQQAIQHFSFYSFFKIWNHWDPWPRIFVTYYFSCRYYDRLVISNIVIDILSEILF